MKKIVAFSILLALLSAAVFAQDDGGSGWKIGFSAGLARNFFYATKATGEWEATVANSPAVATDGTTSGKFGDHIKGSSNMWTWTGEQPWSGDALRRPDNRLLISLSNSGDHYAVYLDAKIDNIWVNGFKFIDLLSGDAANWYFQGDTGAIAGPVVFDGKVGTGRYGGFVPAYEFWNDWVGSGDYNFFGVQRKARYNAAGDKLFDGWIASDNISNANINDSPWDAVYALGATFGGNFRFAIGSTLDNFYKGTNGDTTTTIGSGNEYASASSVQAAFMLSGKGLGPLSFDVFYAIKGGDKNTVARGTGGSWENLLGVYAGLNIVEKLGLSVGYTAQFRKDETQEMQDTNVSGRSVVAYENEYPVWSGVDIKLNYSGIEKVGLTFNNNISFAAAAGKDTGEKPSDTRVYGLDYTTRMYSGKTSPNATTGAYINYKVQTENWFALNSVLGVDISLSDNLGVTFALLNLLEVTTYESEIETGATGTSATTSTSKTVGTKDELRAAITAQFNAGNATFGIGLNFGLVTNANERETEVKYLAYKRTTSYKDNISVVKFGVPVFFKVSI